MEPHEVFAEHALVRVICGAVEKIGGTAPELVGIGGITVAKQLNQRGITAVGWGPGDSHMAHMADESVSIDELLMFVRMLTEITVRLLGVKG